MNPTINTTNKLVLAIVALATLASSASAILYEGTFTGTVTSVHDNSDSYKGLDTVGDTFTGTYSYESDSGVDGYFNPNSGNFKVSILFPDGSYLFETDDYDYPDYPELGIESGAVTYFTYITDYDGNNHTINIYETGFVVYDESSGSLLCGDMTWTDPNASSIPDSGTSLVFLAISMAGLAGAARLRRRAH